MMRLDFRVLLPAAAVLWGGFALAPASLADDVRTPEQRISGLERQIGAAEARLSRVQTAQLFNRPPADIPQDGDAPDGPIRRVQDAADLDVRVDRLENQMRTLNGQIEQTQFEIRRLGDELKKFREDIDLRLQDQAARPSQRPAPQKRADAAEPADRPLPSALPPPPAPAPAVVASARPTRGDAFDPNADPDAPGAPRALGSLPGGPVVAAPDAPIAVEPDASQPDGDMPDTTGPLDLSGANPRPLPPRPAPAAAAPPAPAVVASTGAPGPAALTPGAPGVAPPLGGTARDEFDVALAQYKQGAFETAQASLDAFIQKYPKDRLVPDAVYFLGETYSQRGRYREAAEQYLKVATDYSKSSRAPEGLVRLGVSLNALGAKEQACATFGEVTRKYPNASAAVKSSVDREIKRAKC